MPAELLWPTLTRRRSGGRVVATVVWLLAALSLGVTQAWPDADAPDRHGAATARAATGHVTALWVHVPVPCAHRPDCNCRDSIDDAAGAPLSFRATLSLPDPSTHVWHATPSREAHGTPVFRLEQRGPPSPHLSPSSRS
jgi:hypothetical protein